MRRSSSALPRIYEDARIYGLVAGAAVDNRSGLLAADGADVGILPRGTWRIATNTIFSADWVFLPGATLEIATGVTVTFNGDVTGGRRQLFTGTGTVVLAGQRSYVYPEWFGARANQSTQCAAAFARAKTAMTGGGVLDLATGSYMLEATVPIDDNTVHIWGDAGGYNPELGGTILRPTAAFATSGEPLIVTSVGSLTFRDFTMLGPTTDPTVTWIGIRFDAGSGDMDLENVQVNGARIGFQLRAGNVFSFRACRTRNINLVHWQFGGTADFLGPVRIYDPMLNNGSAGFTSNAETASGRVLHVASTAGLQVGMGAANDNIEIGATITELTETTVTISADVLGTIASGKSLVFGWHLSSTLFQFLGNAFDVEVHGPEIAGGVCAVDIVGTPGLLRPDAIWFRNLNVTLATHYNVRIRRGLNIKFDNCWIGDCRFGDNVSIEAIDDDDLPDANFVEGVTFNGCGGGGAGKHGINFGCGTNLAVLNSNVVGNGQLAADTYDNVRVGAAARGTLRIVANDLSNGPQDSVQGNAKYSVNLLATSMTGGVVHITDNTVGGVTGDINDNSAPIGDQKVIENNTVAA